MSKVPSLNYDQLVRALSRDGWRVIRQRGSHIRMEKRLAEETLKITVPAHEPIKRSTLSHLLKEARIQVVQLLALL